MSFLNPQGFLGLLLALPIIAVYLLRLQYSNYVVPSILLWQSVLQDRSANHPWQKFVRHWLLFLQLLVLLLITISLAQPVLPAPLPIRERIFVLVDISASMLAHSDQEVSRFDRAADKLHRTLATLSNSENLTLIAVANDPHVVIRNADVSQVNQELNALSPTHEAADWAAAGQLTRSLAGEQDAGNVTTILVSDFASDQAASSDVGASSDALFPGELFIINVGDDSPNVGIVHLSIRQGEQNSTVFVRIQNAGPSAKRTLDILADGILTQRHALALEANEDVALTFNDIPADSWIEARLLEPDALTVDDRAWAALDMSSSGTVLLVTSGNRFLAQALANLPTVAFHQTDSLTVEEASSIEDSMLVVDIAPLPELPRANMWLIAPDGETKCGIPGQKFIQPSHVSGQWQHPMLQYVDWSDVHLQRVRHYQLPDSAEVLLYSSESPILWTVENAGYRIVCTAFQLQDSDLPLRLAFPILTSNIVGWLSPHMSTEPQFPLIPGELWRPSLPANTTSAVLIDPQNNATDVSVDGSGIILDEVGLYRYIATTPASQQTLYVAVSLMNPQESDIRQRDTSLTMTKSASVDSVLGQLDVSRWTTGLAVILCCLEAVLWWGRGYRVTKQALFPFVFRSGNLFAMVMRLVMLACLMGAFFGVRLKQKVRDLGIVFVVDRSESTRDSWLEQQSFIEKVLENKTARDQTAIVLFGSQAWVDRSLSHDAQLAEFASLPSRDATDIEQAVRLASALIPPDVVGRIVLLSDGLETLGQGQKALMDAMDQGQDVLLLKTGSGVPSSEVWIDHLDVPSSIYPGDQVPIQVSLATNKSQTVRVNWSIGSQVGYAYFDLSAAESVYQFSYQALSPGFIPIRVCVEPVEDHYVDNNCADNWLVVQGTPQILIVAESSEGANLAAVMRAGGMQVVEVEPSLMPQTIEELAEYSAIVLVNTPVRDLPRQSLSILDAYISDLGGGLIAAGGPTSFGVGGWLGTPLEAVLPVEMRVPDPQRFPPVVMALVIDTSGSMASEERGIAKITLAAEAALRVTESLNVGDTLLVVGYSDVVDHTIGPVEVDGVRDKMKQQLYGLRAGGGGIFIYESLDYTINLLAAIPEQVNVQRQVLLLADGGDAEHQPGAVNLARETADAGISISSISIGSGEDVFFLQTLADAGQGRYYLAANASDLPAIFTEEVLRVKRSYIVEETFTPKTGPAWSPLAAFTLYPPLHGYVATAPKATSEIILFAGEGDPILAVWQYGLGRSVAWTSDVVDRWSTDWITWDAYASFWNAVLRDVLMQRMDRDVEINVSGGDEVATVEIDIVPTEQGQEDDNLDLSLRFSGKVQDSADIIVQLEQVAPGRYSAEVPNLQSEPYLVRLYGDRNFVYGWAPPPAKEYLPADADTAMTRLAAQSGGRIITSHEDVVNRNLTGHRQAQPLTLPLIVAAALLWVGNIIWRRLALSWKGILGSVSRRLILTRKTEKRQHKAAGETSTISELKDRKLMLLESAVISEGQTPDHIVDEKREDKVLSDEATTGDVELNNQTKQEQNLAARLRDRLRGQDKDEG